MKRFLLLLLMTFPAVAQTISTVEPSSAPTSGGVFVRISGMGLVGFPLACPALACANYVQFGDALGSISINTEMEIIAVAPPHPAGTVDLTVNIAGKKKITLPAAFSYEELDSGSYTFVLLPILAPDIKGAFGSLWHTEASISNNSDTALFIAYGRCGGPGPPFCISERIAPHQTLALQPLGSGGIVLPIQRGRINDVDISLRIRDLSRQSQTWGTSIPVVREADFRPIIRLHNVPTDSAFRSALRIYGHPDISGPNPLLFRVSDETTGAVLVSVVLDFSDFTTSSLSAAYPQIVGHDRVRIEIESASSPPKPIWAFVSVANNETQHVTVIAP